MVVTDTVSYCKTMQNKRKVLKGEPISGGIVLGVARLLMPGDFEIAELVIPASRVRDEIDSLDKAIEDTVAELRELRDSADRRMGGAVSKIFDAQLLIAGDIEFLKLVKQEIRDRKRNAGFIYSNLVGQTTAPLKNAADEYLRQMASDIEAVANRVLSHLSGYDKCELNFQPNTIVVAGSLSPGDVLSMRERRAVGFLISEGGKNSHMALITRALFLPVVLSEEAHGNIQNDTNLILDGTSGEIIINPTDADWATFQKLKRRQGPAVIARIKKLVDIPPKTADGKEVPVGVNLTIPGPVDDVLAQKKFPVGLYRTEFLYLTEYSFPDEDTQFTYYSQIAQKYGNSNIAFRVFDLGYDKLSVNDAWPHEDNPALGWRGIRALFDMEDVFITQLRAILRASTQRNVSIMLPMVTDIAEIERTRKILAQVKFDLKKHRVPFDDEIKVGIMVEVPSAAMMADVLAQKVDFLSIGTNDLTQYTLASDRLNSRVSGVYSAYHPSVLRLMRMTIEAGKRHNIPVSICGEIAGDPLALPLFIGMGVDLLSMSPSRIFDLCRLVHKIDASLAKHLAPSVLESTTQQSVVHKLQSFKQELEKKPFRKRK